VVGPENGWMMAESREVMNIRQASVYLGVSPDTLYRYVCEDRVPAFKLGNRWKFKKAVLDRWMEREMRRGGRSRPEARTREELSRKR
jgi:excisionase family DNA binding protein